MINHLPSDGNGAAGYSSRHFRLTEISEIVSEAKAGCDDGRVDNQTDRARIGAIISKAKNGRNLDRTDMAVVGHLLAATGQTTAGDVFRPDPFQIGASLVVFGLAEAFNQKGPLRYIHDSFTPYDTVVKNLGKSFNANNATFKISEDCINLIERAAGQKYLSVENMVSMGLTTGMKVKALVFAAELDRQIQDAMEKGDSNRVSELQEFSDAVQRSAAGTLEKILDNMKNPRDFFRDDDGLRSQRETLEKLFKLDSGRSDT
jgi:hypothetical protein